MGSLTACGLVRIHILTHTNITVSRKLARRPHWCGRSLQTIATKGEWPHEVDNLLQKWMACSQGMGLVPLLST